MAVALSKSQDELQNMPLVELAYEILRSTKEPIYFRDLMKEIQEIRGMSEDEAMKVIARLYTELNIDGRFLCLGQNVWGLKRWYPVDKTQEKSLTSKRFVRKSTGDAFSDDEDDDDDGTDDYDEDEEDLTADEDEADDSLLTEDDDDSDDEDFSEDEEDTDFSDDEDADEALDEDEAESDDEEEEDDY